DLVGLLLLAHPHIDLGETKVARSVGQRADRLEGLLGFRQLGPPRRRIGQNFAAIQMDLRQVHRRVENTPCSVEVPVQPKVAVVPCDGLDRLPGWLEVYRAVGAQRLVRLVELLLAEKGPTE